jgi:hypothetical protein
VSRDDAIGTHRVSLGACDCPTQPHEEDWAEVLDRHDYATMSVIGATAIDETLFLLRLVRNGIREWNLVTSGEKEGTLLPLEISDANVDRLSAAQKLLLLGDVKAGDVIVGMTLPNPPAARSASGPAAGSNSRTSRRKTATR